MPEKAPKSSEENRASRAEAWGVTDADAGVFANAEDYFAHRYGTEDAPEADTATPAEWYDAFPEDIAETPYSNHSLRELTEAAKDAHEHGDISTVDSIRDAILAKLDQLEAEGQLTKDGSINRLEQIDRNLGGILFGAEAEETPEDSEAEPSGSETDPAPAETDPSSPEPEPSSPEGEGESPEEDDEKDKEKDEDEEVYFTYELPEELLDAFKEAADRYAELTAVDRKSTLKRLGQSDKSMVGKLLQKIPGVSDMLDSINERTGGSTQDAREAYQKAKDEIQSDIKAKLEAQRDAAYDAIDHSGLSDSEKTDMKASLDKTFNTMLDTEARKLQIGQELHFEQSVVKHRQEKSKPTNGFVNWWVNQKGFTGKLKKAGVVLGTGVGIGITGGLIGGAVVTTGAVAAGGAASGLIANHVTKRRANAKMKAYGGDTLAEVQSVEDFRKKEAFIASSKDRPVESADMTSITEARSDDEALSNRRRMKTAVALGALGAKAGVSIGGEIANYFTSSGNENVISIDTDPVQTIDSPTTELPAESFKGLDFNVEYGNGYTHELMEFAQANGRSLSPEQGYQLHLDLMNKFGADYINIDPANVGDIYNHAGDIRLMNPGSAQWTAGVPDFVKGWMSTKGLW